MFGTVFGQSQTVLRFGVNLGTDVFGFCLVFLYHCNLLMMKPKMVHGREGTEKCPIYEGPRFRSFCVLLLEK